MRVGIDNYGLYPLRLDPMETLRWARQHGAEGVLFSGLEPEDRKTCDDAYIKDLAEYAASHDLYLEWGGGQHIPRDMNSWSRKDLFEINRRAAGEAAILGTRIVRSCSGGLMRWNPDNPSTEALLKEAAETLMGQKRMLKGYGIVLAIETHFEFTTHELLRLFERCEAAPGEWLGVCLDTMNLLTMLEDPLSATERILPWVVSTHIKDGGVLKTDAGLTTFPCEIGRGVVDIEEIIRRLCTLSPEVNLSVEDHGGDFQLPINDRRFLSEFPDLTAEELERLLELARNTREKVDASECAILERDAWPEVCEARLQRDIEALKNVTSS